MKRKSVIIVTDNQPTETVAPSEEPKSTEEPTATEKPAKKSNISDEDLETLKGQKDIIRYQFEQQYLRITYLKISPLCIKYDGYSNIR